MPISLSYSSSKVERLEARLSSAQKELIQGAADIQGRTLIDFGLACSQEKGLKIILEHE